MSTSAARVIPFPSKSQPKKIRFNKRTLEALRPPVTGRVYVYDETTAGLALCVTANGRRTFYFVRKVHGRTLRLRLGAFPEISIEQARKLTAKAAADIAEGRDPQAQRRSARLQKTLGELFDWFVEEYARPHKKSWREDVGLFNRYLSGWRCRKLSTIRKPDVRALHTRIGQDHGRYAANRTLSLLQTLFAQAINDGLFDGPNPVQGTRRFKEQSRERFLQADELPRFFQALAEEQNDCIRDYLALLLLTGARRSNVLAMRWDQLHLGRAEWKIPDSKSGDPLTIHLPAEAVRILRARQESVSSPWVFPSRAGTAKGHLRDPNKGWKRLLKRAGLKDLRMHDLRRTLGSWQAAMGTSLPIIGKSLGHRNQSTTAIYARLNLDPVRDSVDRATAAMLAAAGVNGEGGPADV